MDRELESKERRLSLLDAEGEIVTKEAEIAERKAMIREAKARYGKNWAKELLGAAGKLRIDKESMQTLHGLGVDGSLRDLNDPRPSRR